MYFHWYCVLCIRSLKEIVIMWHLFWTNSKDLSKRDTSVIYLLLGIFHALEWSFTDVKLLALEEAETLNETIWIHVIKTFILTFICLFLHFFKKCSLNTALRCHTRKSRTLPEKWKKSLESLRNWLKWKSQSKMVQITLQLFHLNFLHLPKKIIE